MIIPLVVIFVIGFFFFTSKRTIGKEEKIGEIHLKNKEKLDPFARGVIENWVKELQEEMEVEELDEATLWRLIGLKIKQARYSGELGDNFKELRKNNFN